MAFWSKKPKGSILPTVSTALWPPSWPNGVSHWYQACASVNCVPSGSLPAKVVLLAVPV